MFKRMLSLLLALTLCLSLAACGNDKKPEKKDDKPETNTDTDEGPQTPDNGDIIIGGEDGDIPLDGEDDLPPQGEEDPKPPVSNEQENNQEQNNQEQNNQEQNNQQLNNQQPASIGSPATTVAPAPSEAPADFFDNAVFIGDSVTLKLRNYDTANDCLYGATFLCQGSYSVAHAVNNTMYLKYQGQDITPQDALKACGADKVFILLGMNDIALWGIDKTMENWGKLISNIRSTCPDIEIYIQSGTPIYLEGEVGSLTNKNMDAYNVRLLAFAQENGCYYVDVNTPFRNSKGGLAPVYCSDAYVHFTDAACKLWLDILMKLTV